MIAPKPRTQTKGGGLLPRRAVVFPVSRALARWLLLLVLAFPMACNRGKDAGSPRAGERPEQREPEAVPVKVVLPEIDDIALSIRTTTSVEADREADVYSKAMGFCQRVFVEEGDWVRAGQLMAKLEDRELRLALQQGKARLDKVRVDYERAQQLVEEGLISRQMYQDLSLQMNLAEADYELARKRLGDTSILSPISGVVSERNVKMGDLVTTSQPLFEVVDLEVLEAVIHIPEQDYLSVQEGQEAVLSVDAFPDRTFVGRVVRVDPVIDPESGTAEAVIGLDNQQGLLRPGMFVRVQIIVETHRDAVIVPKEAVLIQGDRKTVFVVRDGLARSVQVVTGFQEAGRTEILEGLTPEDPVIVMGHLGLQGDTRVRIIEEPNG